MYHDTLVYGNDTFYIVFDEKNLLYLDNNRSRFLKKYSHTVKNTEKSQLYTQQLHEYFNGTRNHFDFNINPKGTPFQESVWEALLTIPYGTTVSYTDIAMIIGDVKKVRAVANAIGKNPIMIVIPCHRVIGKDGKLHGFGGGLPLKKVLLELEKAL